MKLLVLSLVLLSAYSTSGLKLEKLCTGDVFKWQKAEVNTYYRISNLNSTIANQTSYYLLNETLVKADFWFKAKVERHNNYVREIFTKSFLKESSDFRVSMYLDWVRDIYKELAAYRSKVPRSDLPKLEVLLSNANRTSNFMSHLLELKKTKLTYGVLSRNALQKALLPLPLDKKNETLVFDKQLLDLYYNKGILKIDDFEHGTRKANGTVNFSVYVPVSLNATKYKNEKDWLDRDCKTAWLHLPKFFEEKGKL